MADVTALVLGKILGDLGQDDIASAVDYMVVGIDVVGVVDAVTRRGPRSRPGQRPHSGVAAAEKSGMPM